MTRVAIAGLGAIGRVVARRLADGMPGLTLACAAARDRAKAQAWLDAERIQCPLVELEAFPDLADLAVECAPAGLLERICRPMLAAGKTVMVLSAGALLPHPDLIALAKLHGGQIIVPTGALLGLARGHADRPDAALGPERTRTEIWADPALERNCHTIEVDADSARFTLTIENIPSENPKTGRITALSVLAALRKLHAPLRVGT